MKKITLSLLAAIAFGFTANAQTPDVKIGAKAGVNFANLSNAENNSNKTGFNVGAVVEVFINEKFSIQPELLYSTQGTKIKFSEEFLPGRSVNVKSTLKLDYINVPIMGKYYVADGFNVQFGPQIGFLTTAKHELDNISISGNIVGIDLNDLKGEFEEGDIKDMVNKVDFGLNFGLGYEHTSGVFADVRYNLGLTSIDKKIDGEQDKIKNGVFQISVGFKF
ncbi:porin family protein [Myroides phaeus]|uniref:porin family protein n=1 Tax=Myroides phaeus TaxID=702745 RepID=UPI002DBC1BE1|nr:porin family protein [Myroides phaeus]MEC4116191.1 porin family protein [Myroides phaeus]